MPSFPPDPQWIATAVETPLMAILAWMLHSLRRSIAQNPELSAPPPAPPAQGAAQQNA